MQQHDRESAHLNVKGRVQGVSFRAMVKEKAEELGIAGFARNLPKGDVQVVAQGTREKLDALLDFIRSSPGASEVEQVEVRWAEGPHPKMEGFGIRR